MTEYPKQIFCVWGNNVSLDAAFNLCAPFETGDTPPLELHEGALSRFTLTLLDRRSGTTVPISVNIAAKDVSVLQEKMRVALYLKECKSKENEEPLPIAYTTLIMIGSCANRTPADVLLENPSNQDKLLTTRKWLVENINKYSKNKDQIAAIDNALEMLKVGELTPRSDNNGYMVVYDRQMKTSRAADEDGFYAGSDITITCNFGKRYPWCIQIANYKTKKKADPSGKTIVDARTVKNKKVASINLSDDDFIFCITRMREVIELYQAQEFRALYEKAMAAAKKQAANAKEKNKDKEP